MLKPQPDIAIQEFDKLHSMKRFMSANLAKLLVIIICSQVFILDWTENDGWWKTWIAMSGFFAVVAFSRPGAAVAFGFLFGILALGGSFWWAKEMLAYVTNNEGLISKAIFVGLIAWESLLFAVVGFLFATQRKRNPQSSGVWLAIGVWLIGEAYMPRVFRWTLGHSQIGALPLVQSVDLGGASVVSMNVLCAAVLPTLMWDGRFFGFLANPNRSSVSHVDRSRRARLAVVICMSILAANAAYGFYRPGSIDQAAGKSLQIGVVQEDPAYHDCLKNMRKRSFDLPRADIIVWPESALGVHSVELNSFADPERVFELSKAPMISPEPLVGLPAPIILGGRSFRGDRDSTNTVSQSAFIVDRDGAIINRYHKRSLMPLGEYVPGESTFPWLHDLFQMGEYFEPGNSDKPITVLENCPVGVIVCYEDTMSEVVRSTVCAGAELILCIINDSAFESPVALRQHLKLSRLRAIENRRYFVRSAGTGISCVISPTGIIQQQLGTNQTGEFLAQVHLRKDKTLFQVLGNWPPKLIAGWLIGLGLITVWRRQLRSSPT